MDFISFKNLTEERWQNSNIHTNRFGFQIQRETKWNQGLEPQDVASLEHQMGFLFPCRYRQLLQTINGFDRDCLNVYGNNGRTYSYSRQCYKYPDDLNKTNWLLEEIYEFRAAVDDELENCGFNSKQVVGFIPFYGHRAIVAFHDPNLSPVISIVENDVIVYGLELMTYLRNEFLTPEVRSRRQPAIQGNTP